MSELTSSDLDYMNRTARLYMNPSHNPRPLLASAAEMLAASANAREYGRLLWWWNEGVRDYANSEEHRRVIEGRLMRAARVLTASDAA